MGSTTTTHFQQFWDRTPRIYRVRKEETKRVIMSSESDPNGVAPSTTTSDPSSYLLLDDELNGFFDDDDDGTNLNVDDFLGHIQDDDNMMTTSHSAPHIDDINPTAKLLQSYSTSHSNHHVPSHQQNNINHVDTRQVPSQYVYDELPRTATSTDEDDIIIDGTEPTLQWHNESVDRPLRQAMIRIMYVHYRLSQMIPDTKWSTSLLSLDSPNFI